MCREGPVRETGRQDISCELTTDIEQLAAIIECHLKIRLDQVFIKSVFTMRHYIELKYLIICIKIHEKKKNEVRFSPGKYPNRQLKIETPFKSR